MSKHSKFLSLVLRHKPSEIDITLDRHGWVSIDTLLSKLKKSGRRLTREDLMEIVTTSDKKRFTISEDGKRIRAAQGHSVDIDLALEPQAPPRELYHGTASASLDAIFEQGLVPGKRKQVHLSLDPDTAEKVGRRHGRPVVLRIATRKMHEDGHLFYQADNGVWLTDHVPAKYLGFGQTETQSTE